MESDYAGKRISTLLTGQTLSLRSRTLAATHLDSKHTYFLKTLDLKGNKAVGRG